MAYLPYLFGISNDAFGKKKARGELGIIPWRAHRDRDRAVSFVRKTEADLERFLYGEQICKFAPLGRDHFRLNNGLRSGRCRRIHEAILPDAR